MVRSQAAQPFLNGEDIEVVGTAESETHREADLTELCLLLASGFYGRRKVENLGEIDEYPWRSGASALCTNRPHVPSHLCRGFLSSPLLPRLPVRCCD